MPDNTPLWIGDAANRILASWEEWEAEAGQAAQSEQCNLAGEVVMLGHIERAIEEAWQRDGKPRNFGDLCGDPLPGRENVKRGEIEWFTVAEPSMKTGQSGQS